MKMGVRHTVRSRILINDSCIIIVMEQHREEKTSWQNRKSIGCTRKVWFPIHVPLLGSRMTLDKL